MLCEGEAESWIDSRPRIRMIICNIEKATEVEVVEVKEVMMERFLTNMGSIHEQSVQSENENPRQDSGIQRISLAMLSKAPIHSQGDPRSRQTEVR
jgi:hypothetical protein